MYLSCFININENSVFLIYLDLALNIERMLFVRILNYALNFKTIKLVIYKMTVLISHSCILTLEILILSSIQQIGFNFVDLRVFVKSNQH